MLQASSVLPHSKKLKKTDQLCKSRNLTEENLKIWCFFRSQGRGAPGCALVTGPVFIPWRLRRRSRNKADGINCKYHWRRNPWGRQSGWFCDCRPGSAEFTDLYTAYWAMHFAMFASRQPSKFANQSGRHNTTAAATAPQSPTDVIGQSLSVQRRISGQMVEGSERSIADYS